MNLSSLFDLRTRQDRCNDSHPEHTYSCVGIWQQERCEIIANDQGNCTTP